jgi:predicted RNA-binding Zn ribbon-like protein
LDFINTEMMRDGRRVDLVPDLPQLLKWMELAGLLTADDARTALRQWRGRPEGRRLLTAMRRYRSEVRHLIERLHGGGAIPQAAVQATNQWLRHGIGYPQLLRSSGRFETRYHREHRGIGHVLAVLAESVADILAHSDRSRIKRCRNQHCILYFFDSTKNQARRWCCMSLCGNRVKVAAHYRRHRAKS